MIRLGCKIQVNRCSQMYKPPHSHDETEGKITGLENEIVGLPNGLV